MSLTKKDPSLRVAANDPHLVSLGGGRLSTAVTIHYIPIGDTTIGCSTTCSISLNGTGVRPTHCTIYRSEENEVTIVPERDARILIDGTKITHETNLTQGAMITIGNSNYLRFNNPAEAQMMRSAMGSNERISMPQIDFTQMPPSSSQHQHHRDSTKSNGSCSSNDAALLQQSIDIDAFYESKINPNNAELSAMSSMSLGASSKDTLSNKQSYKHIAPIDINGLQCPKVFTADLVTVNMPAKDVLGQKYANFARNLAENHRNNDKNVNNAIRNNQMTNLKSVPTSGVNGASSSTTGNYVNIPNPNNFMQNSNLNYSTPTASNDSTEYLTKVNNVTPSRGNNTNAYDRYPKPGTYGGLQIYPMNGVNTDINNGSANSSPQHNQQQQQHPKFLNNYEASPSHGSNNRNQHNLSNLSSSETEHLEDMLKICTEYADRQNHSSNSITSSPIVQNRIKTNGSLPRDKKSPFYHDLSAGAASSLSGSSSNLMSSTSQHPLLHHNNSSFFNTSTTSSSSGYENVRLVGQNRVEINGQMIGGSSKTGYENVVVGKYVPQSPRTKIRTTCMSPKKEHSFVSGVFGTQSTSISSSTTTVQNTKPQVPPNKPKLLTKQSEYEQLIKTFEEKLKIEMQAIEESSRYQPAQSKFSTASASLENSPARRTNKNINNLTLNLHAASNSLQNSPRFCRKPAPAPRSTLLQFSNNSSNGSGISFDGQSSKTSEIDCADIGKLRSLRKEVLARIAALKREISELQKQENEVLRELDMEKALVTAELNSVGDTADKLEQQLQALQNEIHRADAQRNATRVMEENQQAKLKQSIEMKQDQAKKLKIMLKQKPNNECLKEELHNVTDSLENDRKTFEDLEFQYLEKESEWQGDREELHAKEKLLMLQIEEKRLEFKHLEKQEQTNQTHATMDAKSLKHNLIALLNELKQCQERLKSIEHALSDITGQLKVNSSDDDDYDEAFSEGKLSSASTTSPQSSLISTGGVGVMSQSLFGSAELLCPKVRANEDIMSKSVNENMFYNNKIELPCGGSTHITSTPKRAAPPLQVVDISDAALNKNSPQAMKSEQQQQLNDSSLLRSKCTSDNDKKENEETELSQNERVKFNLSLGSDDFEVNPLEKRVPSQDDIDRISKVTLDAPISTPKGASTKIFDSIKEIERNRQLLLAQQGHHVIEHERQKMNDLKKKCHDEARAQYLSMLSCSLDSSSNSSPSTKSKQQSQEMQQLATTKSEPEFNIANSGAAVQNENTLPPSNVEKLSPNQLRHSQPEFDLHYQQQLQLQQQQQLNHRNSRPLSESNSELSCDLLSENNTCKSSIELSTATSGIGSSAAGNRYSGEQNTNSSDDAAATKRSSSVNSNETASGGSGNSDRKRALPKHQRPLTRYLPIFSPDLNLRHHIESAGHQIALCPHVFVDSYSCRGYLHKLGATFHGWARRWFVLDRQRNALIYFSDKSERKPRGGAYFSTIDEVYLDHLNASKSGRPHCTFIVKTKKRSYHLQAASDAAARIWIDAIITGAQGNLDY